MKKELEEKKLESLLQKYNKYEEKPQKPIKLLDFLKNRFPNCQIRQKSNSKIWYQCILKKIFKNGKSDYFKILLLSDDPKIEKINGFFYQVRTRYWTEKEYTERCWGYKEHIVQKSETNQTLIPRDLQKIAQEYCNFKEYMDNLISEAIEKPLKPKIKV